jgi:EH domain-containing protein 1
MADFATTTTVGTSDAADDRTAMIASRLKQLYTKSILPVEKKYRYDYFFDSPLLSDVEFDGTTKNFTFAKYNSLEHR